MWQAADMTRDLQQKIASLHGHLWTDSRDTKGSHPRRFLRFNDLSCLPTFHNNAFVKQEEQPTK